MIDFSSDLGARASERLTTELVVWLTTVAPSGMPQPHPVWFIWHDGAFLIYSQSTAKKLAHIAANPQVSLHFNGTADGDDIQIFLASATIERNPPPALSVEAYLTKYRAAIDDIGMTPQALSDSFNVLIRAAPSKLRGM